MDSERQAPAIGSRFRKLRIDPMTGVSMGMDTYTVVETDEPRFIGWRVVLKRDGDGRIATPCVEDLWGDRWQAVENIVSLRRPSVEEGKLNEAV